MDTKTLKAKLVAYSDMYKGTDTNTLMLFREIKDYLDELEIREDLTCISLDLMKKDYTHKVLRNALVSGWKCQYGIIWDLEEGVYGYSFISPTGKVYETTDLDELPLGMDLAVEQSFKRLEAKRKGVK